MRKSTLSVATVIMVCLLSPMVAHGAQNCSTYHHKWCSDGDVYWYDSCDQRREIFRECPGDTRCGNARCEPRYGKTFGGPGEEIAYSIVKTNDGKYLLTGVSFHCDVITATRNCSFKAPVKILLIKINPGGKSLWQKEFEIDGEIDANNLPVADVNIDGENILLSIRSMRSDPDSSESSFIHTLIKLDSTGNVLWEKVFPSHEHFLYQFLIYSPARTILGNYFIADMGFPATDNNECEYKNSSIIYKLDEDGNIESQTELIFESEPLNAYVVYAADTGYIVKAHSCNEWTYSKDSLVISEWPEDMFEPFNNVYAKFDTNGKELWRTELEFGISVIQETDNGYDFLDWNNEVTRIDSNGKIRWKKPLYCTYKKNLNNAFMTEDNGFLISGSIGGVGDSSSKKTKGGTDLWVAKTYPDGFCEWTLDYGEVSDDEAVDAIQTNDGGYLVVGNTESKGAGRSDILLLKLNKNGEIQW